MAIETFNRYEQKYILNKEQCDNILKILNDKMLLDKHNKNYNYYTISNIYYDTIDDYLIRRSLEKPKYKEKLRLRSYGVPTDNSFVFLEIKKKINGIVNKRRSALKLYEAYDFINYHKRPEYKGYMNKQVLNELEYFTAFYSLLPKLYLAYDRLAYTGCGNDDLRISFDTNIRSRRHDLLLETGDYGKQLLQDNTYIMEIKTTSALPLWLTHLLAEFEIKSRSFSKYGTEFTQLQNTDELIKII